MVESSLSGICNRTGLLQGIQITRPRISPRPLPGRSKTTDAAKTTRPRTGTGVQVRRIGTAPALQSTRYRSTDRTRDSTRVRHNPGARQSRQSPPLQPAQSRQYVPSRMSQSLVSELPHAPTCANVPGGTSPPTGGTISIVATIEGSDAHVADAHRAARARHKRAPKCRYRAPWDLIVIAQTG